MSYLLSNRNCTDRVLKSAPLFTAVFILVCTLSGLRGYAQNTNKVWAFGWGAGLDFNTTPPTPFYSGIYSLEGVASISDASGQLLMYCYGDTIYNRLQVPMPNGSGILGTPTYGSCTQGALIVPRPGSSTEYYVFALEGLSDGLLTGRLFYNLVDMSLNGGLGDVVTSQKRIQIDSLLGEKMTAVAGPCGNIWVLVIPFMSDELHAFEVTAAGVNPVAVISQLPPQQWPGTYDACVLKASHNGKKLVAGNFKNNNYDIFDFDNSTGVATGPVLVLPNATQYMPYGACFSPDDSRLYVFFDSVYQFNMSLPTNTAIINSRVALHHSVLSARVAGDMKLGPDGKIYMATENRSFLSTIEYPNVPGTGCTFMPMSIQLPLPSKSMLGLPNEVVNAAVTGISSITDTTVCSPFMARSSAGTGPYLWNTGDTAGTLNIVSSGTYWVTAAASACGNVSDTFRVSFWDKAVLVPDVSICKEGPATAVVSVNVPRGSAVQWSTGDTGLAVTLRDPGLHWVRVSAYGCVASDTFNVILKSCQCELFVPNAFTPNNDGINDVFYPSLTGEDCYQSKYMLHIYNRWGQMVFDAYEATNGWNGTYKGKPAETGVYHYYMQLTSARGVRTLKGDISLIR